MKAKNSLKIQVKEPCMQSWSAMTPDNVGRFCGACSKTVIDFSTYTDQQLIDFFTQSRTERVCGRFQAGQLDRSLGSGRNWWSWVRSVAALLLPFLLTSKADAQRIDSTAQIDKRNSEKVRIGQVPRVLGRVLPNRIQLIPEKKSPKADIDPRFQPGRNQEAIEPRPKGEVRIIH